MILIMKIWLHNDYKIIILRYPTYVYQFFNFPYNYKNRVLACFQTRPRVPTLPHAPSPTRLPTHARCVPHTGESTPPLGGGAGSGRYTSFLPAVTAAAGTDSKQRRTDRQIILLLHGRPVGVMVSCLRFLWTAKIIQTNNLIITREAGWCYGIMSTVPYEQQKLYRQIIFLLHGRPVGVMVSCLRFLWTAKIIWTNNLIITREAGNVMVSCLRFLMNSKNYTDK